MLRDVGRHNVAVTCSRLQLSLLCNTPHESTDTPKHAYKSSLSELLDPAKTAANTPHHPVGAQRADRKLLHSIPQAMTAQEILCST
jgi:hypothetical protein